MDIFHLLGKEEDYREHGGGRILSVESPRADLVEEKVKELVDRDIQKHGRSTILGFKSPSNIKLPVTQSPALFTYESTPLIWVIFPRTGKMSKICLNFFFEASL